ncbi:MAG: efflux transporter outer membrane subunit [Pseudomonadota bacterium]
MPHHLRRTCCWSSLACGLFLLSLTSCMIGPDFQRPEVKVPSHWLEDKPMLPESAPATIQDLAQWWSFFNDSKLTSLIERAIQANLDLRMAESRIRQARATVGVAGANLGPGVDSTASYKHSRSPLSNDSSDSITSNLYKLGFDAAWEIDLFGGMRRGIEATTADFEAAIESRRDLLVSLSAEVAGNYLNLRSLQLRLSIAHKNLKAQEQTVKLTHQLFDTGFVGKLDVVQAEALAATTASHIPLFEASIRQTIYTLSLLLGHEPSTLLTELSPNAPLPVTPPPVPPGLPSELLLRRPDIRMAEAKIHAATARIGIAKADLFPKFTITGSLGLQNITFNSTFNQKSSAWSLGPSLNWPLFDMGRSRANLELQKAVQEEALLAYEQTVLNALGEVEQALIASTREQEHHQSIARAVTANGTAVDLATTLYAAGQNNFLAVLDAQRSLYAAEDTLAQSSYTLSINMVALFKALGGGWQANVVPP